MRFQQSGELKKCPQASPQIDLLEDAARSSLSLSRKGSMRILHVISSVNPKYGGPIEGITQLSKIYVQSGATVEICSMDSPTSPWVQKSQVKVYALGPPSLWGYWFSPRVIPWLKAHHDKYDAVIVNGLWQYSGYAVRRALAGTNTPYFVFTHGMLDPWFKRAFPLKHLKKWLYWPWGEYRVLRDASRVIFTCDQERLLARESFWLYHAREAVISYGVDSPPTNGNELAELFLAKHPHLRNKRIALFLSRIHLKKGCDLLIGAFEKVAKQDPSLELVIAGPDDSGLSRRLKDQATQLGISDRITWTGMLQGEMKWGAFYASEVFCLPSHTENFGIVVAEALACGRLVLISNKVNIAREIQEDEAGFVANDDLDGTQLNFERWLNLSPNELGAIETKAKDCFKRRFHVAQAAKTLLAVLTTSTDNKASS